MKPAKAKQPEQSITPGDAFAEIEAREIDVTHWPKREHPPWRAACFVNHTYEAAYADTPLDAVAALLRKIGGEE